MPTALADLLHRFPKEGRLVWIGVRPERRAPLVPLDEAMIEQSGIAGDHARDGKRAVTLIQAEHLPVIGTFLGQPPIAPERLRRNLVIEGINLLALRGETITVGSAALAITGPCAPCSRMEEELGEGGYAAMRGHGGMTARVLSTGPIALGAPVRHVKALDARGPTASRNTVS